MTAAAAPNSAIAVTPARTSRRNMRLRLTSSLSSWFLAMPRTGAARSSIAERNIGFASDRSALLLDFAQVHIARLGLERAAQAIGQRVGRVPVEVAPLPIPGDLAVRQRDEKPIRPPLAHPPRHLVAAIGRSGCAAGGEEDQPARLRQVLLQGGRQSGTRREIAFVAEDFHRPDREQGFGQFLQTFLDSSSQREVRAVAVGYKGVAGHVLGMGRRGRRAAPAPW